MSGVYILVCLQLVVSLFYTVFVIKILNCQNGDPKYYRYIVPYIYLINGDISWDIELENSADEIDEKIPGDRTIDGPSEFPNIWNEESLNPTYVSIGKNSVEVEMEEYDTDETEQDKIKYNVDTDTEPIDDASLTKH